MHAPKATRSKCLDGRLPASMLRRQMTSRRSVHKRKARSMSCGCPSHCIEPSHDRSNGMAKSGAATNRTAANKCASRVGTGFGTMRSEVKSEAFHRRAASCKSPGQFAFNQMAEARHASGVAAHLEPAGDNGEALEKEAPCFCPSHAWAPGRRAYQAIVHGSLDAIDNKADKRRKAMDRIRSQCCW